MENLQIVVLVCFFVNFKAIEATKNIIHTPEGYPNFGKEFVFRFASRGISGVLYMVIYIY